MWLEVTKTALTSRLLLLLLQTVFNQLVPDHDAGVFKYPSKNHPNDIPINIILGGLKNWDAQYFMHISLFGYTYENTLAFFPLLPMLIRLIATPLQPLINIITIEGLTLLLFTLVNTIIFVLTANTLYKLTKLMYNKRFALKCVWLFSYNPASIFFSAAYTESLFALLTFNTILNSCQINCRRIDRYFIKSVMFIALSTCTRSNGLLNVGFLCYAYLHSVMIEIPNQAKCLKFILNHVTILLVAIGICLVPFCCMQFYFYGQFCKDFDHNLLKPIVDFGEANGLVLPGTHSLHNQTWCDYKIIPLSYSYVQAHYWDVGFFKYYTLNNIPNFMLAVPIVYIVSTEAFKFLYSNFGHLFHLGLFRGLLGGKKKVEFNTDAKFVCVVHIVALMLFCLVFVHVQVTTRMLCSASPVVYWFAASIKQQWVKYYFVGYYIVGTTMFANFLPWT